ncbi:retinol-binding protein pinta-like [Planococcus citri]|uniref:retinol-binding protein pinta-like n=1 Tax=Planococcus citri TaxID=170843 RepID=UPI0031F8078C
MQQEVEKAWKISVQDELIRNTQLKMQHIDEIQTWIRSQSQLPKISDNQVILFLHATRYNLAESKKLIETYYKMRTQYRHYFAERDPLNESIIKAFNVAPSVIHGKDNLGRRILWSKLLDTDPQLYFPTIATKVMYMVLDVDQVENGTVPGYTLVLDGKGFSFSHAMRCSFTNGRQVVAYVQTASTVIIEKVYLLNLTSASEKLLYLLRPFIRSELLNKITTCTEDKISKIEEMIPKSSIPSDYNGEAPSIKELTEEHLEKLQSYRDWFVQEENLRMKDVKSIPSNETPLELEGTFNNLSVD